MKIGNATIITSNVRQSLNKSYFATRNGLILNEEHIDVLDSIQNYYTHHDSSKISLRNLSDALEEKFHHKGGMKYLYSLFPGGPITQGCQISGLTPPKSAIDKGFGSAA
jgi:TusE/DsrC/DsvC family sulfur relay protein